MTPERRAELLSPPGPGRLEVVVDTDVMNEVDDQFALVWSLLRQDRLHLRAFLACPFGLEPSLFAPGSGLLTELDRRHLETGLTALGTTADQVPVVSPADGVERARVELERLVALAGSDVPVVAGSDRYLPDERTPVVSDAATRLVELAHEEREGPLYVVAIGCATNVASALLLDPSILDRVVVLWTAAYPSFWPYENASYNLAQDVPAARVLLTCGVPLLYLPGYYVGEELRISGPELQAHVRGKGVLGDYLWDSVAAHPLFALDRVGSSKVIWDLVAVAWLLAPEWFTTRLVPTPTLDDALRWQPVEGAPLMLEAHDVSRDLVYGELFRLLAEHAAD